MNKIILVAVVLAIIAQPSAAATPTYRIQPIVSNGVGVAYAINDVGDVAGQLDGKAFVWKHGKLRVFQPIDYSPMGGDFQGQAKAINHFGIAAGSDGGYFPCAMSGLHFMTASVYDSTTRLLRTSGQCEYEVDGINDAGTLVGVDGYRGFIRYADGKQFQIRPLSHRPVWNGTRASAIDNEGHVVGGTTIDVGRVKQVQCGVQNGISGPPEPMYCPDMNAYIIHAFRATFDGGRQYMRDLGALFGYPDTYATAIADNGIIVGYSGTESGPTWTRVSGSSHAWIWENGHMSDLGRSKSEDSYAYGVNDRGIVVGCAGGDAVRWVNRRLENLNDLIDKGSGWHLRCAYGINHNGVIVGQGVYQNNALPFRLVPQRNQ